MFDFRQAMAALDGKTLNVEALLKQLDAIRQKSGGQLSPEIGTRELFLIARHNGWVVENADGNLSIQVPAEVAA